MRVDAWERYLTELLLQFLISIVDTELFEAVHFECFKTDEERKEIEFPSDVQRVSQFTRRCREHR